MKKIILGVLCATILASAFGCSTAKQEETTGKYTQLIAALEEEDFDKAIAYIYKLADEAGDRSFMDKLDENSYEPLNLIGEWILQYQEYDDGTPSNWKLEKIKLYEDGTSSVNGEMGTWKIVGDELMILGSVAGGQFWNSDSIVGEYKCDGTFLEFERAHVDGKDNSVNLTYRKAD